MPGSSQTATELSLVLQELEPLLLDARVRDIALLDNRDDVLIFLDCADTRRTIHVALGSSRARVTLTHRRFRREEFRTGPLVDRLRSTLEGATLTGLQATPRERRCQLSFSSNEVQTVILQVELFGVRGFWCLVRADGVITDVARLATSAKRSLRPGDTYTPPPTLKSKTVAEEQRFEPPYAETIDDWFTERDRADEIDSLRQGMLRALLRAEKKLAHMIGGLQRQSEAIASIPEIRLQADMLLAHGFSLPPKTGVMEVPDPNDEERTLTYALQPGVPIQKQADALYKRARKLEASARITDERRQAAGEELERARSFSAGIEGADPAELQDWHQKLTDSGLLPKRRQLKQSDPPSKSGHLRSKRPKNQFRTFASREGYQILVGRNNQENDRLSVTVARGNDLWFHIGKGYAGSHVVVRVPKGKTASLETMIDAGTLATHFSKQRGTPIAEVIYTQAKNIRKPKGLPPGRVTASNTKSLIIRAELDRLDRLLNSNDDG